MLNMSFLATNKLNVGFIDYQYDGKLCLETIRLSPAYTVTKTFFYCLTPEELQAPAGLTSPR